MKKSLIALAALGAFAGAASAQSSVTLYGLVDASVQYAKSGDALSLGAARDTDITRLEGGRYALNGSRWGMRVSEDLGGGLRAGAVLESGFTVDDGAQAQGALFGRQAFVSLASSRLGEIRLGRQYTMHDELLGVNNPFPNGTILGPNYGYSTSGSLSAVGGTLPLFIDVARVNNAVQYLSPSFAGFSVQAIVAAGEGAAIGRYQGLKASYANGPLNAGVAYEQNDAGSADNNKLLTVSANYDFGVVRVFAGYQQGEDLTAAYTGAGNFGFGATAAATAGLFESKSYTVGASMPFGAFTVGVNYSQSEFENATGADVWIGRAAVGATYNLSKTTRLYTAYGQAMGDMKNAVLEKQLFQVGVQKAF